MKQIRQGVFETNSSSTHSLTMVSKEEYDKFAAGELLWDDYAGALITKEAALKRARTYDKDIPLDGMLEDLREFDLHTLDDYYSMEYETFKQEFTTKSGDVIVAFGYYGYN